MLPLVLTMLVLVPNGNVAKASDTSTKSAELVETMTVALADKLHDSCTTAATDRWRILRTFRFFLNGLYVCFQV
jgi:hypothetical protein